MRVGGVSAVTFQVTNTGVYDLNAAYMVLGYDPSLVADFENCQPAPAFPGRPAGSCEIPLLTNSQTYSYTARFRAAAIGTAHFTLLVQDAEGATTTASSDVTIEGPSRPPPNLVAGTWKYNGQPEGMVYAVDSPDTTSQVSVRCTYFYDGLLGPAPGIPTFPGMPATRFIQWSTSQSMVLAGMCYGAWVGEATGAEVPVDTSSQMSGVAIASTSLTATTSHLAFSWSAPPDARSFLVLVVAYPAPYDTPRSWIAEQLLPGAVRSVDFGGLTLTPSTQYTALVYAFSADLGSSAPLEGQLNMQNTSIDFTPTAAGGTPAGGGQPPGAPQSGGGTTPSGGGNQAGDGSGSGSSSGASGGAQVTAVGVGETAGQTHPGPPRLELAGRALSSLRSAVRRGSTAAVSAVVTIDEPVVLHITGVGKDDTRLILRPRSRVGLITTGKSRTELTVGMSAPGSVPLSVRLDSARIRPGAVYRIDVVAVASDGQRTVLHVPFRG
jgi:hypothetical protein